jgi:hypothetical protein
VRKLRGDIPQAQGGVRQLENILQTLRQNKRQIDIIARQQQGTRPCLKFC